MPRIAIIDDRQDHRETLERAVGTTLPEGWEVISSAPLPARETYLDWLPDHEVGVLVLDEKLKEQASAGVRRVRYNGHELVAFLRSHLAEFPIYVVTSYSGDEDLQASFGAVDGIDARDKVVDEIERHVPRWTRSAQRFLEANEVALSDLSCLAGKVALGKATHGDKRRLRALQQRFGLEAHFAGSEGELRLLAELEAGLLKAEQTELALRQRLKGKRSS